MSVWAPVTRNPFELAVYEGIPVETARALVRDIVAKDATPFPGWGRGSMQHHIVARRHASNGWTREDRERIASYPSERTIFCQGRDGDFILQYAIPKTRGV